MQMVEGDVGNDRVEAIGVSDKPGNVQFEKHEDGSVTLRSNGYIGQFQTHVAYARFNHGKPDAFRKFVHALDREEDLTPPTKGGPKRWGEPIVTPLVRGKEDGPFAIDTLTIPYKNRFGALFFCTGLDFLPDGRIALCTCHGDVWLVTVNEKAGTCSWQRFATG